jgi:DNA-binding SARP family transcriptional activator
LGAAHIAAHACLLRAIWLFEDNSAAAAGAFVEAERRIALGGYAFLFEAERASAFAMLAAHVRGDDRETRSAADRALTYLGRVPPRPLRITGLGRFEVQQGQRRIPAGEWKKRKAGDLFRLLLLQPKKCAHRDVVMAALWPEADAAAAQQSLHHATSALRRVLEPDLPDKFPSRYLTFESDVLSLQLPSGSTLDFEVFEKTVHDNPLGAADYGGHLFPDDSASDWAVASRERLRELYLGALLARARDQLQAEQPVMALETVRTMLAEDPWREDAVLIGMRAAMARHDRPAALRLFAALERTLQADLGIAPRADLRALAAELRARAG